MSILTDEYKKEVLEDLNNYVGLYMPVKVGLVRRLLTKRVSVSKLHPNPKDEFSMPEIGPNYEIVGNYAKKFERAIAIGIEPIDEPLIIEKITTGGYMLLNGHHRWMAAKRVGIKRVKVQLINTTLDDEILNLISKSDKDKCVSFDLDEVLLTDGVRCSKDKKLIYPLNKIYQRSLRKNAGVLIDELRMMGFAVWIYSGNYHSMDYIEYLLRLHGTKVDGIINGLSKRSNEELRKAFIDKFDMSLHIDNDSITCVNTRTKEYEIYDINTNGEDWAAKMMLKLKEIVLNNKMGE